MILIRRMMITPACMACMRQKSRGGLTQSFVQFQRKQCRSKWPPTVLIKTLQQDLFRNRHFAIYRLLANALLLKRTIAIMLVCLRRMHLWTPSFLFCIVDVCHVTNVFSVNMHASTVICNQQSTINVKTTTKTTEQQQCEKNTSSVRKQQK